MRFRPGKMPRGTPFLALNAAAILFVVSFLFAPNGQIDGWRVATGTPEQVVPEGQSEKLAILLHASGR